MAIHHAIEIIIINIRRFLILLDSKSVLQKIFRTDFVKNADQIALQNKHNIILSKRKNCQIELIWIPSHSEIKGYNTADQLPNEGRSPNIPLNIKIHYLNFLPIQKKNRSGLNERITVR